MATISEYEILMARMFPGQFRDGKRGVSPAAELPHLRGRNLPFLVPRLCWLTMKGLIIALLLLVPFPAMAGELIPVNNAPYGDKDAPINYEWKFKSDPTLRYVAYGYDDGVDYSLDRVTPDGKLKLLLEITPVIEDSKKQRWWGYAWDTNDIYVQVRHGVLYFYADFKHYVPSSLPAMTDQPVTMPALLLKGETTEPDQRENAIKLLSPLNFKWYSLPALIDMYKHANATPSVR